jgi:hypothetical protein
MWRDKEENKDILSRMILRTPVKSVHVGEIRTLLSTA